MQPKLAAEQLLLPSSSAPRCLRKTKRPRALKPGNQTLGCQTFACCRRGPKPRISSPNSKPADSMAKASRPHRLEDYEREDIQQANEAPCGSIAAMMAPMPYVKHSDDVSWRLP